MLPRNLPQETAVVHDLEVRAYNLLRQENANRPRILVLLVLPEDESEWLTQSEDALMLRRCAYWASLRGAEASTAHTTVRIMIPRANVFSVETVQELMDQARKVGMR